jgi:uncharacterized protein YecE (DUF72 family)
MRTPGASGQGPESDTRSKAGTPGVDPSLGPLFAGTPDTPPARKVAERDRPLLRYDYLYSESELQEWVGKIRELDSTTKKTFVFFNNCHAGQAATSAKLMRRLLEGEGLL